MNVLQETFGALDLKLARQQEIAVATARWRDRVVRGQPVEGYRRTLDEIERAEAAAATLAESISRLKAEGASEKQIAQAQHELAMVRIPISMKAPLENALADSSKDTDSRYEIYGANEAAQAIGRWSKGADDIAAAAREDLDRMRRESKESGRRIDAESLQIAMRKLRRTEAIVCAIGWAIGKLNERAESLRRTMPSIENSAAHGSQQPAAAAPCIAAGRDF